MRAWIAALSIVLLSAGAAHASGYMLWNQGSRAAARANAYVATAADPSALFYNPAGITQLDGIEGYITGQLIFPYVSFRDAVTDQKVEITNNVAFTISGFATWKISDIFSVGSGIYEPFGLMLQWPASSPGRTLVRKIELRTYFIPITLAADLSPLGVPGLSLAAGVNIVPASAEIRRDILFPEEVARVKWVGDDVGVGGTFGLLYRPDFFKRFSLGVMYSLPVSFGFKGNVNFTAENPVVRAALPPDGTGRAHLTVPMVLDVGIAYCFLDDLQAEFDLNWVGWYVFDKLTLRLPDGSKITSPRDWNSEFAYRLGVEYSPMPWAVRIGYAYDRTPVPDTTLDFTLPDVDRHVITLGFGFALPWNLWIDLNGWIFIPRDRETSDIPNRPPIKGKYSDFAWVAGIALGGEVDWFGKTTF